MMAETKFDKSAGCVAGARHESRLDAHDRELNRLHAVDQEQWAMINQIRNRLPVWATIMIGFLMAIVGSLVTLSLSA